MREQGERTRTSASICCASKHVRDLLSTSRMHAACTHVQRDKNGTRVCVQQSRTYPGVTGQGSCNDVFAGHAGSRRGRTGQRWLTGRRCTCLTGKETTRWIADKRVTMPPRERCGNFPEPSTHPSLQQSAHLAAYLSSPHRQFWCN